MRFEEVWVIVGPVFDNEAKTLRCGVEIPVAFYRVFLDEENGQPRMLALVVPQGAKAGDTLERYLTSVNMVEELTGVDFFSELEDTLEERLEAEVPSKPW